MRPIDCRLCPPTSPASPTAALALRRVAEGPSHLLVPADALPASAGARGAARAAGGVLFNPAAAFARDLSVLFLAAVVRPGMRALDGLTGVGARAWRWWHEVRRSGQEPGPEITANDWSPAASTAAEANLSRAKGGIRLVRRPLVALLAEEAFDFIEIDAAGTPVPFLDAACQSLRARCSTARRAGGEPGGHLLVTATDAMVLAGAQPGACRRRYGAEPMQGELGHEVAVRILLGAIVRCAARYGLAVTPAFSYWRDHWYGAALRVARDEAAAEQALRQMGYAARCAACWDRWLEVAWLPSATCRVCGAPVTLAGPLWCGALWEGPVVRALLADARPLAAGRAVRASLAGWLAEADAPPLFYDLHAAASFVGTGAGPPPISAISAQLAGRGYRCARTHFAKVGIRTDAPTDFVLHLVGSHKEHARDDSHTYHVHDNTPRTADCPRA